MEHKFVSIKSILPKQSYVKVDLIIEEEKDNLIIYYINKYQNGKLKSEKFQPRKAKISKNLKLNQNLVEGIGLYQGDGQKSINSKSYQTLRFSNSNLNIILHFLNFLDTNFNIKPEDLNGNIRAGTVLKNKISEQELINYWSKNTKIPIKNFYKVGWNESKYLDKSKAEPYGNLSLIYQNSSFRIVFDSIFNYIKKQATKDEYIAIYFLKGLIAADGNVYYNSKTKLREVNIAAKEKEDRNFIRILFNLIGIQLNKDNLTQNKETVRITGLPNFIVMNKYNLCSLHPNKDQKFKELINSYKNSCYRKGTCIKLIEDLLKKEPQTVYELATKLNRKPNAIRRYFKILELQNKIKKELTSRKYKTGRVCEKWNLINL